jgi:hypothetical protein
MARRLSHVAKARLRRPQARVVHVAPQVNAEIVAATGVEDSAPASAALR